MTMRMNNFKAILKAATLAGAALLLTASASFAQQQVNLTAGPTITTLPDGTVVPMWGYSCGAAVTGGSTATCAALNPAAAAAIPAGWSPVVITVPTGQALTINLTNSLSFLNGNSVPTSLVIVGQLGGGLGDLTQRTTTDPPDHSNAQQVTWPVASPGPANTPPTQGPRVQSFSTEVAAGTTAVPGQCASPCSLTWTALRPGTYLIESGTHPSIQGPMGLYGMLVVTTAPGTSAGIAYPAVGTTPAVTYNADVNLLLSEIDPVQNNAVNAAVNTLNFLEANVWSGQPGGCGNPSSGAAIYQTCYPPAVNYSPLYYLFNGAGFDKTNSTNSLFPASPATGVTGNVLVRLVNAGLRMHIPSIVGSQIGTAVLPALPPSGFSLIAEDGNPLPGIPRIQSEVFLAAGKTYDVMMNVPAAGATALPVFDRQLSLSSNATARDGGMLAYIGVNGAVPPSAPAFAAAVARNDPYPSLVAGQTFSVSDPSKGVIANDTNVYGVQLLTAPTNGTVTLNANGTFTYVPSGTATSDSFTYCANGSITLAACSSGITATVNLTNATLESAGGIHVGNKAYTSTLAGPLSIKPSGVLSTTWSSGTCPTTPAPCHDYDAAGYPLSVNLASVAPSSGLTLTMDPNGDGGFTASAGTGTYTFTYQAQNSQGVVGSGTPATVTLTFPTASNLNVTVLDGRDKATAILDYRWIIEEDRTFYVDPTKTTTMGGTATAADCTANPAACAVPLTFGTNFHTSYMPLVAAGCVGATGTAVACETGQTVFNPATGLHDQTVCDVGNGVCRTGPGLTAQTVVTPGQVYLDPTKRYYLSVLPGDAGNPFAAAYGGADCTNGIANVPAGFDTTQCGHGMGGTPVVASCTPVAPATTCTATFAPVTVYVQPDPFPTAKLSVFVFEDDFPLNGEQDGGGGTGTVNSNHETGLGQFNIVLMDDAGGTGDATGQMSYDMLNQPLVNSLAGTIDPLSQKDACPISLNPRDPTDPTATGITGTIVTCPQFESDGVTPSPLAGQAVVVNLMIGRYGVVATPGADRIAKGEEWVQTNTLDGGKAHDSFLRVGGPSYFQEFGPAGYHVTIGFANPTVINSRKSAVCTGHDPTITVTNCTNSLDGTVTTERMSRTPDQRLYSSGDNSSFSFTQCYVSFGDPDGEDFAFTKCDADGKFTLSGLPDGDWRITVFDQWNDVLVDGLSTPVRLAGGATTHLGQIAMNQWQANLYTLSFFDQNRNGIQDSTEPGLTLVPTNIRFRDGSYSNFNNTDLTGAAGFNEIFPLFSWYVVESDSTRFKNTGTHVIYDAGGPSDGSTCTTTTGTVCGNSATAHFMANTAEQIPLPSSLQVPGAKYCGVADCLTTGGSGSTGRIDPPWVATEGWQGFSGQNSFIEFGKMPFAPTETGGIHGEVIYASTRPFDDPTLLLHTSWTPDVPGVTINLYQEGVAADNITPTLKLVDTTKTSSWDDWAQGFYPGTNKPYMACPGQGAATGTNADLFFYTLYNQPDFLDVYNNPAHNGTPLHTLPSNSQFKCYDGMHNWNQVQPATFDGAYQFPSVTGINPTTGAPAGTNCTACIPNPDATDPYRVGTPMLPAGKYVVEVVVPPGYELVKEEDKNILIGDNYIAPVTVQFPGLAGAVYILPDQAEVAAAYNANNAQNPTNTFGRTSLPSHEGDTGSVETFWPCVGASRIVPDYISLFPQSAEVAPFAGATRNLCDRKEVTLDYQSSALAKFWVFTSTHVAAHFTGVITDDFTSEFDPFSPQFGEKFSPPNLPISLKDWTGTEISRVYADQWGTYDGMTYSSWEVNPPNPTGYGPTMMVTCMNDPGPIPGPAGTMITDPLFNPQYSQFCYEIPFMPGQTQYMDTPVVPTSAFAGAGYNNPDCAYPALTPAISEVDGDSANGSTAGPWVSTFGHAITIHALGDQSVPNNGYSGPSATAAPFNAKTVTRHYGFGAARGTGTVSIGGNVVPSGNITTWTDTTIVVTVAGTGISGTNGLPPCYTNYAVRGLSLVNAIAAYGQCGQLVITTSTGKQSVDAVTVTVGGKAPVHVTPSGSIQTAIDAATPGDLIIIDPTCATTAGLAAACTTTGQNHSASAHSELLIMWKPVRLQGVGAASSIINANSHPSGKLDAWRARVDCLFGLSINSSPTFNSGTNLNPFDPTNTFTCGSTNGVTWNFFTPFDAASTAVNPQVDRLPLEAAVGWDAELNGNLAEMLQEPSLMGALEGAGITVLGKGVNFPSNPYDPTLLAGFPAGTTLLTAANCGGASGTNPFSSNFWCNPSSIDGLGITDSSQGGGGIFVHGWGHNLQIANDRIYSNAGTLSGGINVGQGEFFPAVIKGAALNAAPYEGTSNFCSKTNVLTNAQLPYCDNVNVNIHNNYISSNSSNGDELFSGTPAGAGGVSICTGSDYYLFNYNWVCGNLSGGDGGGFGHLGFSYNGDIEHNSILFNQSTNPTIQSNGGGMIIMGTPDTDLVCSTLNPLLDQDCVANPPSAATPSDGVGPGLVINANLIMGNGAEAGSGGGIAFQATNGSEVVAFPITPANWYQVLVTNNIITNNVAGWDGAGISLVDSLRVDIINNTIMSNDTTASSGVLFNTLGAPLASTPPNGFNGQCSSNPCGTASAPQPAGLVAIQNSAVFSANLPATVTCPAGHFSGGTATNGTCKTVSYPLLANDVFWQNREFHIGVGSLGPGTLNQQNVVALYNGSTSTPVASEPTTDATTPNGAGVIITGGTGACVTGTVYWDLGVRGDTGPANHSSTVTLAPSYSLLTPGSTGYSTAALHNSTNNPTVVSQYCNGSRTPPEFKSLGYQVPPGIADATVPNPIFNLTPAATVDEGNNWINISWGPLAMTNTTAASGAPPLGNYALAATSPAINYIPNAFPAVPNYNEAPPADFFNNPRKNGFVDAGAVEFQAPAAPPAVASVTGGPLAFGNAAITTTSAAQNLTLHNTGGSPLTGITVAITAPFSRSNTGAFPAGAPNCGATLAAAGNCTIKVVFSPTVAGATLGSGTITASVAVTGSPVALTGTGIAAVVSATLTPTSRNFGGVTRTCPGTTLAQIAACLLDPAQVFTLTNTGNVMLTGIAQGALGGTNATEFSITRLTSTCGPTGGGQLLGQIALAPGATCVVTVQFKPLTAQTTGAKAATVSVTDAAGTQTSTLTGTAN